MININIIITTVYYTVIESMQRKQILIHTLEPLSLKMISTSKILPNCWKKTKKNQMIRNFFITYSSLMVTIHTDEHH